MIGKLREHLSPPGRVAMEYTPDGALPRVSKVDAGTLEMVRGLGVEVESSADLLQYATQRWDETQLESHVFAAEKLTLIVKEAFRYIGDAVQSGVTEHDVAEFIRNRFLEEGLIVTDGPAVAVNEHASDPHFDPTPETSVRIEHGDWVLIDLWTRLPHEDAMFGDITWTAYVGNQVPAKHQEVFDVVTGARDAALAEIERAFEEGRPLRGWELDKVGARLYRRGGLRGVLQPPPGSQSGQGGTLQRGQPGLVGDLRYAPADSRHRGDDRAGGLCAGVRGEV